jgi:hypothetical protein
MNVSFKRDSQDLKNMGIRERLNKSKWMVLSITIAFVAIASVSVAYQLIGNRPHGTALDAFYSDDDGHTWFTDSGSLLPPFDRNGKTVVQAYVYECNGKQFVGYLERLTPRAIKLTHDLEEAIKNARPGDPPPPNLGEMQTARRWGLEVKKPGDKDWVSANSSEGIRVEVVKCPDGNIGTPDRVYP